MDPESSIRLGALSKTLILIFGIILPLMIYITLPKILPYFGISGNIDRVWWIGVTLILVGIPFMLILHLLGYRVKSIKSEKAGVELKHKNE